MPFMVRFRDINDPKSVERVDPNNLVASFGAGVKLVGASIEITNDQVATGIEKKLAWLPNFYVKLLEADLPPAYDAAGNELPTGKP